MGVIRTELERKARRDRRLNKAASSQVVRPTELDEMDSPYALPEAVVMPVPEEDRPDERRARLVAMSARQPQTDWPPVLSAEDVNQQTAPEVARPMESFSADDVNSMQTALTPHPDEGPTPPVVQGVRAPSPTDLDTLEVERKNRRVTRPLHKAVGPGTPSYSDPVEPSSS